MEVRNLEIRWTLPHPLTADYKQPVSLHPRYAGPD